MSTYGPSVIVSISYDKSRQDKKEVYSKIAVIDGLAGTAVVIGFKQMVGYDKHSGYTA